MDVVSVIFAFDLGSGWAKSPSGKRALYRNDLYTVARLTIKWSDGETEGILFTYLDHGAHRDVYSGSSPRAGRLVFKIQSGNWTSSQKEWDVRTSLQGKVISCLWVGEVARQSNNEI